MLDIHYVSRFFSVGIVGAVFDNLVLFLGVEVVSLSPLLAKAVSAESAIVLMFLVNEHWTFAGHGNDSRFELVRRLVTSNLVRVGGLAVGVGVLYVLHTQFGVWYLAANVLGIGLGFVVNYVSESVFTWKIV